MPLVQIIFLVFAVLAVLTSLGLILLKDPVHCALLLVLTFANIAGIYILLGAEFLAAIQVMVYSGAILVLFLFVMMLLQLRPWLSLNPLRLFQSRLGPLLALAFLAEVLLVVFTSSFVLNGGKITDPANTQAARLQQGTAYSVTVDVNQEAGPIIVPGNKDALPPHTVGHTAALGKELYSTYLFPFEIASLILLIAAIGAIVIARPHIENDPEDIHHLRRGFALGGEPVPGSAQAVEVEHRETETPQRTSRSEAQERTVILKK